MPDVKLRAAALIAVIAALLNSGVYFQRGEVVPTIYFLVAAILVTLVTHLTVRRNII